MSLPKVLIVEDEEMIITPMSRQLDGFVDAVWARTVEKAKNAFAENSDFICIFMDGIIEGDSSATRELTRQIRETFSGPIIATSCDDECKEGLIAAGCDFACRKDEIKIKIKELLLL